MTDQQVQYLYRIIEYKYVLKYFLQSIRLPIEVWKITEKIIFLMFSKLYAEKKKRKRNKTQNRNFMVKTLNTFMLHLFHPNQTTLRCFSDFIFFKFNFFLFKASKS